MRLYQNSCNNPQSAGLTVPLILEEQKPVALSHRNADFTSLRLREVSHSDGGIFSILIQPLFIVTCKCSVIDMQAYQPLHTQLFHRYEFILTCAESYLLAVFEGCSPMRIGVQ